MESSNPKPNYQSNQQYYQGQNQNQYHQKRGNYRGGRGNYRQNNYRNQNSNYRGNYYQNYPQYHQQPFQRGKSTKRISKARPCCPIISITNNRKVALESGWLWGVYAHLISTTMPDFIEEMEAIALKIARDLGVKEGSRIIIAVLDVAESSCCKYMNIFY